MDSEVSDEADESSNVPPKLTEAALPPVEEDPELKESELDDVEVTKSSDEEVKDKGDGLDLQAAMTTIDQLLDRNADHRARIVSAEQRIANEMEEAFAKYIAMVTNRAVEIKREYTEENKEQTDRLLEQQDKLQRFRGTVESALKDPNGPMNNPSMISKVLRAMEEEAETMRIRDLSFDGDHIAVAQFISSIGTIGQRPAAPVVTLSEVSPSGATVQFESECTAETVIYCIRYRLAAEPEDKPADEAADDERKENEWSQRLFDRGTTGGILDGLESVTRYEVYGVYKESVDGIWSESSEITSITTTRFEKVQFEWDVHRRHPDIKLKHKGTSARYQKNGFWRTVISKNVLTAESMKAVTWELTLGDVPETGIGGLKLGFVDANEVNNVRLSSHSLGSAERPKECALYIYKHCLYRLEGTECVKFDAKWKGTACCSGDRVSMRFDFDKRKCTVWYNDEEIGVLSDAVPGELFIVANPYTAITLDTTKFEAIPNE